MNIGRDDEDPGVIPEPAAGAQPGTAGAREASFTPQAIPPSGSDPDRARRARTTQWIVVAAAAMVMVVIIAAGGFAIGYAVGKRNTPAGNAAIQQGGLLQRLQSLAQSGASVLRGQVTEVKGGSITVQTPRGAQEVALTATTRFSGTGVAQGAAGSPGQTVNKGNTVIVVARKSTSGGLEALAVRIQNAAQSTGAAQGSSPNGGGL